MSAVPAGIPDAVREWLHTQGCGAVTEALPLGGGCIHNARRLRTQRGADFFLKTNAHTPPDLFAREAKGLQALFAAGALRVPQALLNGPDFLLLEYLPPAPPQPGYWSDFGRRLAALHSHTAPHFGFAHDNYLGSTPQPNLSTADGYAFFAEQRLLYQARLAARRGLLTSAQVGQVERLAARLPDLIPPQPASLLHGDLWSGNAIRDERGQPALIDPAAHYGWAEAELGMTDLFGGFPAPFYAAYCEARALEKGWRDRLPLYNLYHLLNHVNLFGASYLEQTLAILNFYTRP